MEGNQTTGSMTSILDVAPDASCHDADQDAALKPSNFSPISDRARQRFFNYLFVFRRHQAQPLSDAFAPRLSPAPGFREYVCEIVLTAGFLKGLDEQAGLMDVFLRLAAPLASESRSAWRFPV